MEFRSGDGQARYDALVAAAGGTIVGLDLDGTLSPIVDDPSVARIHPDAGAVLVDLAEQVLAVAVITGRPARQALALGGLDEVGQEIAEHGKELYVFGQYGHERWSSTRRRVVSPRPPAGLAAYERELPRLLRRLDAGDAFVEDKGLAVAVHTRQLPEPAAALDRLLKPISELATRLGLTVEPGRNVIEARAPGAHKGDAVHRLAAELDAGGFLFAGDDLGDVEAFAAVEELRDKGLATLRVCSASREQSALVELSDLVVPGPDGVLDLLRRFTADAAGS